MSNEAAIVVSHLGAVVGLVAGELKRAHQWIRQSGLEWLWRVKEEPHLWRRYVSDGLVFLWLLPCEVVPGALRQRTFRQLNEPEQKVCKIRESETDMTMTLTGTLGSTEQQTIRKSCYLSADSARPLTIDPSGISKIDNSSFAYLKLLQAHRGRCGLITTVFPVSSHVMLERN